MNIKQLIYKNKKNIGLLILGIAIIVAVITIVLLVTKDKNKESSPSQQSQPSQPSQPSQYVTNLSNLLNSYLGKYNNIKDTEFPVNIGVKDLKECLKQANNTNHKLLAIKQDSNGNITGCYTHSDPNDNTYNMYGKDDKYYNDSYVLYGLVPKEQLKDIGSKNINCKDINDNIINIDPSEIDSKCKISCVNNNGELETGIFNETINKCKLSNRTNDVISCYVNDKLVRTNIKSCGKYELECIDNNNNKIKINNDDPEFNNNIKKCINNNEIKCVNYNNNQIETMPIASDFDFNFNVNDPETVKNFNEKKYPINKKVSDTCFKPTDPKIICQDTSNPNNKINGDINDKSTLSKCGYELITNNRIWCPSSSKTCIIDYKPL
jgi:hypothetical protein